MSRRVAVGAAVPVGLYAVLFLVSALGGPRIGAPLIPLPGGGGPEAAAPVAGPLMPGQVETLPPVPGSLGEAGVPCQPGPDHACRATKPATTPSVGSSTGVGPTGGSPTGVGPTAGPTAAGPTDAGATSSDGTRQPVEPTPGVAEQPLPSMPPATKTPPRPPSTTKPPAPPGTPVTPSGPPEHPKPTTIAEALKALLETLRP